ncbi:hypothetical protein HPP92_027827, partial [Vanilla planifolia]
HKDLFTFSMSICFTFCLLSGEGFFEPTRLGHPYFYVHSYYIQHHVKAVAVGSAGGNSFWKSQKISTRDMVEENTSYYYPWTQPDLV